MNGTLKDLNLGLDETYIDKCREIIQFCVLEI